MVKFKVLVLIFCLLVIATTLGIFIFKNTPQKLLVENQNFESDVVEDITAGLIPPSTICNPSSLPSLTIISPTRNQDFLKYKEGITEILLEWTSCNLPINTHIAGKLIDVTVGNPPREEDLFCGGQWEPKCLAWNGGSNFVRLSDEDKIGTYQIKIYSSENPSISSLSYPFNVLPDNTPDYIAPKDRGDDVNGYHMGYIKEISLLGSTYFMKIDYADWGGCKDAKDCPNDYSIENKSTDLRTLPISNDVRIELQTFSHQNSGIDKGNYNWGQLVGLEPFKRIIDGTLISEEPYATNFKDALIPFWITIKNGKVIEIVEQYQP